MARNGNTKKRLRQWPVIREIETANKTVFEVDTGSRVKNRIRVRFDDPDQAEAEAERIRADFKRTGTSAFDLSQGERLDAMRAVKILGDLNVSLVDAADFYRIHAKPSGGDRTIREVWNELKDYKDTRQRVRPRYLEDLNLRLYGFIYSFGERDVKEVSAEEIETWLYADKTISEVTRHNIYRYISVLFSYAQGKRDKRVSTANPYRIDNPIQRVTEPTIEQKSPEILNIQQVKVLLDAAQQSNDRLGLLPYVVLALFCGIRSSELILLDWRDVNLVKGQLTIHGRIAKKRSIRNIPIPENARNWLAPYAKKSGPVSPINCIARFTRVVKEAGWVTSKKGKEKSTWPTNAMRHCYGSYLFAMTENAPVVSARMGHKGDDVLFAHYRALCDKSDAEAYFSILPPWQEKIKVLGHSDLQEAL